MRDAFKNSDSSSSGGFVNNAFEDDEEVCNNNISYARWINECNDNSRLGVEEDKQKNQDMVNELSETFKSTTSIETEDTENNKDDNEASEELDIFERPSDHVSRADIIGALSSKYRAGALGRRINSNTTSHPSHSQVSSARTPTVPTISGCIKDHSSRSSDCSRSGRES